MHDAPPIETLLEKLDEFATAVEQTLSSERINWSENHPEDAWTLTVVMCHLRDVEREVHQPRFRAILTEDNPFMSGVTADEWAISRQYHLEDGREAWKAYLAARADTISMLYNLPTSAWQKSGNHAFFGPTTLQELLYVVVQHDDVHWQQIETLVNTQL